MLLFMISVRTCVEKLCLILNMCSARENTIEILERHFLVEDKTENS